MNVALVISIIALCISIASPSISFYVAWRDRARVKITWRYHYDGQLGEARVNVVNAGRRPIVLKAIGFNAMDNMPFWEPLDDEKGGVRLEEHQDYTHVVRWLDTILERPNDPAPKRAVSIWIEDTLGNRHTVPNSLGLIEMLVKDNKGGQQT